MMNSISGIMPVQVISSYTRTDNTGNLTEVSKIQHVKENGVTRVEQTVYIVYNKDGTAQAASNTGSKVDITV